MNKSTCVLENGRILIREGGMYDSSEPIEYVYFWPTRFGRRDMHRWDGEYYDVEDIQVSDRGHQLKFPGCGWWTDSGVQGNTKAVRVEKVPVPKPKVRKGIEVRYYNGEWQKYLKSSKRGWVTA